MKFDPTTLETKDMYKLLSGSVVPRPIAWVSSVNSEGTLNLAPFSFFTVASRQPPMICLSIGPGVGEREGTEKDTLVNIRSEKEFVVNIVPVSLGNQMQKSSENFGKDVDEFAMAELNPIESSIVKVPRVQESPISMECKLEQVIQLGSDHLIIGQVVQYHIKDEYYLGNYKVDLEKLNPLARLAGTYSELQGLFKLPR